MHGSLQSLQAVIDSLDAIVYVADMKTYEVLLINNYTRGLFGDIQGRKCWASLQQGQTGPCDFCSNSKLVGVDGIPLDTYIWDFQNTVNGRWYECRDKAISWTDGRIVRLEIATDVTGRKVAEERLRESEERFRSSFEYAAIGMALVGKDGRFLRVNRSLCMIVGYSEGELLNLTFQEITYTDDLDADLVLSKKLLEGEIPSYKMEKRYIHKNGSIIWVLLSGSVVRNSDGKIIYAIAQIEDITERKRAEEELRLQIERYDLVAAGARDGIWDWDVPNKRVFFSPRWKAMRGFSEEELSDREEEWSSAIQPEDAPRVFSSVQAHFEGKTPWFSEEYRVRRKDGTWMWVHDRGLAQRDSVGRVIRMAGSETDITARKSMEEEREKLIAELKEALAKVKTLSGLLPICSHCKKIRDDMGYWKQIELYLHDHSEAEFSHGICPECIKKFYPEHYDNVMRKDSEE